jgi:hypothetical protein
MNLRRIVLTIAGATALAAGGTAAGAAIAGSPVDSSGVIHGCYTSKAFNGSHVFVLQDAGKSCPERTTAISWNQQGAQGPAGPQGPPGPSAAVDKGTFTCLGTRDPSTGHLGISCTTDSLTGPDKITITPIPPSGLTLSGFPRDTSIEVFDASQALLCQDNPPARQIAGQSGDNGASWQFSTNFVCFSDGSPFQFAATSTFWFAAIPG